MDSLNSLALKLSWSIGDPFNFITDKRIAFYTDYAITQHGDVLDIKSGMEPLFNVNDANTDDSNSLLITLLGDPKSIRMLPRPSTQERYTASIKENSLLGMSFLSYHSNVAVDENGLFWEKHLFGEDEIHRDPLAPDNLMRKGQTFAIISLTGASIYFGSKYAYKYYKNR
jgi:hypothetical protein